MVWGPLLCGCLDCVGARLCVGAEVVGSLECVFGGSVCVSVCGSLNFVLVGLCTEAEVVSALACVFVSAVLLV